IRTDLRTVPAVPSVRGARHSRRTRISLTQRLPVQRRWGRDDCATLSHFGGLSVSGAWGFDLPLAPPGFLRNILGVQHADNAQAGVPVGARRGAGADAIGKMFALALERFRFLDARDLDIAVAVGKLKFAESIVVALHVHALVVNADFLLRRGVVVD